MGQMASTKRKVSLLTGSIPQIAMFTVCAFACTSLFAQQNTPTTPDAAASQAIGTGVRTAPQQSTPGNMSQAPASVQAAPQTTANPLGRRRIGVALGGGGALALSEIGVLRWFEENRIPVDAIAGTSMGSLVGALYATGHTTQQLADLTTDQVFSDVFRLSQDFTQLNFRRREDARFLPGGFHLGLKRGVSFRNGVLLDYGLNQFLNAQFLPYGAGYDFDRMPIPFRCVATDILVGREAVFNHGPLAEAVRASISIPGVFPPLEDGGHIYVDGALTENLPTDLVRRDLHADVVLAVSLPLTPPGQGDTSSLLGILQRSFSVASWSNEVRSRALADVLIEPIAPPGLGAADYTKSSDLADAGYKAAEKARSQLLPYQISEADWATYLAGRRARGNGTVGNIASIHVIAPNPTTANAVRNTVAPLAGQPLHPDRIDDAQNQIRSDGRFESDYFLTRPGQPVDLNVTGPANQGRSVQGRELLHPQEKRGPGDQPAFGLNSPTANPARNLSAIAPPAPGDSVSAAQSAGGAQSTAISNTPVDNTLPAGKRDDNTAKSKQTFETVAPASQTKVAVASVSPPNGRPQPTDTDLYLYIHDKPHGPPFLLIGGNLITQTGGTARATLDAVLTQQDFGGYRSELRARLRFGFLTELEPEYYKRLTPGGLFLAPRLTFYRAPVYIWQNQRRIAERQQIRAGGGLDLGYTLSRYTEFRLGWQQLTNRWHTETGSDGLPDFNGSSQLARIQYRFNHQDRALIPLLGPRLDADLGFQYSATRSQNAPRLQTTAAYFRDIGHGNTLSLSGEGGTFFNRSIADPFRFTLGGPLRLAASAYDEYRGTDYLLLRPAYFRRIATLPSPLGQSIYVLGTYEFGQVYAPNTPTTTREDVFFGLAAETPLGAFTFGPAIGDHDHRKLVFTLGRFF